MSRGWSVPSLSRSWSRPWPTLAVETLLQLLLSSHTRVLSIGMPSQPLSSLTPHFEGLRKILVIRHSISFWPVIRHSIYFWPGSAKLKSEAASPEESVASGNVWKV
jgi:hypothetical protein